MSFWDARAARYDTLSWVHDIGLLDWSARIVERAAFDVCQQHGEYARMLEVGCGSAALTVRLAQRFGEIDPIVAVDISPEMLVRADSRCATWRVSHRVRTRAFDPFVAEPMEWRPFDVVVARMVVRHQAHLGSLATALGALSKRVRPGGALVVLEGAPPSSKPATRDFYDRVMTWKHGTPRLTCAAHDLSDALFEIGCTRVDTSERWAKNNSLRNWLAAADITPEVRSAIETEHRNASGAVRNDYRMTIGEDVLMDWRNVGVIGIVPG